jgi:hypothetical protein
MPSLLSLPAAACLDPAPPAAARLGGGQNGLSWESGEEGQVNLMALLDPVVGNRLARCTWLPGHSGGDEPDGCRWTGAGVAVSPRQ